MDFVTEPVAEHVSEAIASWTPGYVAPPAPYYEACKVTVTDADQNMLLNGIDAEVKVRGNWTTVYDKKPLRIKFTEKQNLLGLNDGAEEKNWVLLAEYKDASMLRDKAALQMAREILDEDGLYASDATFAEVLINGEYWGMYLVAEQQQVTSDRVKVQHASVEDLGTDIGYFLEFDGYFYNEPELQQFHVDYADNAPLIPFDGEDGSGKTMSCLPTDDPKDEDKKDIGMTIKSQINTQEQHDFIENFVCGAYRVMYEAAYNDKALVFNEDFTELTETSDITPQEAVERVIDVDSLADMYIICELTCDADLYWSSFYLSADFSADGEKKLRFEAPWDFDSAMGNKSRCPDGTGFYAGNLIPDVDGMFYETVNPWLAVLMYEDWYQDVIREKWTKAYDSGVFDRASEMITSDTADFAAAFDRNYKKWNNIIMNQDFVNELSAKARKCKNQKEAADYLNEWLNSRVAFLNDYWHA